MSHFIVALAVSLATFQTAVRADLGAAVRRASANDGDVAANLPIAPLTSPVTVKLQKVVAWDTKDRLVSFLIGNVSVGSPPQKMRVLFDTSSGHVLLPHRACRTEACVVHQRYSPWESSTAMDVNEDGKPVAEGKRFAKGKHMRDAVTLDFTQSDLGEGNATGVLVRDNVCIGSGDNGQACVDLAILAATKLDVKPFKAMPNDGIIGLGLQSLSIGPLCSFFGRIVAGSVGVPPQFGISLGMDGGEMYFGGHNIARMAAPLQWFPVDHPEDGYWQVAIQSVRIGNITVDACHDGCHAIIDTGVSKLGVQKSHFEHVNSVLKSYLRAKDKGCDGADLVIALGSMDLTLRPEDYANQVDCEPNLGSLDLDEPEFVGVYAFGEAVLRPYYTAFDWEQKMLGFAPSAGRAGASGDLKPIPDSMTGAIFI